MVSFLIFAPFQLGIWTGPCSQASPKAGTKGQACAIVQDEVEGWKGLLFDTT
jgi:hypothetical protein